MNELSINSKVGLSGGVPYTDFTLPSGNKLRIREQNGEDDDVLSKVKDNKDGSAMHNYIAAITLEYNGTTGLTGEQVKTWGLRDKYYAILKSRRFSLGDVVFFDYTFEDGKQLGFEEDLAKYDWDFSTGKPPQKGQKGYSKDVPQSYPSETDKSIEFKLSSGKICCYEFMTGEHEMKTLGKSENELTLNDRLRFRNFKLKLKDSDPWTQLDRFNMFTAREMYDIRTHLDMNDPDFILKSDVRHPDGGRTESISLLHISDFFFPVG